MFLSLDVKIDSYEIKSIMYRSILIIHASELFGVESSSDQTIRSFLGNYPKEKIFVIACGEFNVKKYGLVSEHLFQLSIKDVKFLGKILRTNREIKNGIRLPSQDQKQAAQRKTVRQLLRKILIDITTLAPYVISDELESFIRNSKAEVIYADHTGYRGVELANSIALRFNLPVVYHFLDDWPNIIYTSSPISIPLRTLFNYKLKKFLNKCHCVLCISDVMKTEYGRRYQIKNLEVLMNCIEAPIYSPDNNIEDSIHSFVFAGSMTLHRDETLLKICETLDNLKIDNKTLDIYCPINHWEVVKFKFNNFSFVNFRGFLPHEDLMQTLKHYNVLLFVESFDSELLLYSKLSVSTRVPEYLSVGKIILAVGPSDQGSIDYFSKLNTAFVVDNLANISDAIKLLISDKELAKEKIKNAKQVFLNNHESSSQQRKFLKIINEA